MPAAVCSFRHWGRKCLPLETHQTPIGGSEILVICCNSFLTPKLNVSPSTANFFYIWRVWTFKELTRIRLFKAIIQWHFPLCSLNKSTHMGLVDFLLWSCEACSGIQLKKSYVWLDPQSSVFWCFWICRKEKWSRKTIIRHSEVSQKSNYCLLSSCSFSSVSWCL